MDAESLVVIDEAVNKGTTGNGNRHGNMFKHGKNGELTAVGFLDQNGNPIDSIVWYNSDGTYMINYPSLHVTAINRLTDDYILIDGVFQYLAVSDSANPVDMYIQSLLLRESDGAIFDFGDQINWAVSSRYWNKYLYTDDEGCLYYSSDRNNVMKLTTYPDGSVTRENILPYNQVFKYYFVDGAGNLYWAPDEIGNTFDGLKVKIVDGGIINYDVFNSTEPISGPVPGEDYVTEVRDRIWVSTDRKVHTLRQIDSAIYNPGNNEWDHTECAYWWITEVNIMDSNFEFEEVLDMNTIPEYLDWPLDWYTHRTHYSGDELIMIYDDPPTEFFMKISGLDCKAGTFRYNILPLNLGEFVSGFVEESDDYIFIAVNSTILKISVQDFSYTSLLEENQYDIFAFSVSDDGIITFNALRYSDARIVLGEIDETGSITIIEEDLDTEVVSLMRLN